MIKVNEGVMLKTLLLLAAMSLLTFTGLYLTRSKSVLFRFDEAAAKSTGGPSFALFNPLRDRSPEQKAEAFLELLRAQPCVQVLADLPLGQERFQYLCQMEGRHQLTSWRMADREDAGNKVKMFYWARRVPSDDFKSQLWITAEKAGAHWKVVDYESWY
jgi:hypothetical protein